MVFIKRQASGECILKIRVACKKICGAYPVQ